jgi:hypothetical protein
MSRQVDTVRVVGDFPGFKQGDILQRYYDNSFILLGVDENDEYFLEADISWRLSEEEVLKHLGTFFQDVTTYEMRSREEVEDAIVKVKESIENERYDYDAVLVWKNLLYCLEWVVGRREYQIPSANENVQKEDKE